MDARKKTLQFYNFVEYSTYELKMVTTMTMLNLEFLAFWLFFVALWIAHSHTHDYKLFHWIPKITFFSCCVHHHHQFFFIVSSSLQNHYQLDIFKGQTFVFFHLHSLMFISSSSSTTTTATTTTTNFDINIINQRENNR